MKVLLWNSIRSTQRLSSSVILGLLFVLTITHQAYARIYIQIDQPSEKKFPVAVVDLIHAGGGSSGD